MSFFTNQIEKIEIHVHLEGSVQPATIINLANRHHVMLPAEEVSALHNYFQFRNFDHFIDVYQLICSVLKDQEDFEYITYEFGAEMAKQRIKYAEVTCTPFLHVANGIPFEQLIDGLTTGRNRVEKDFNVQIAWVFDIPRQIPNAGWPTLEFALAGRSEGVVALGLGGNEADYPPEDFVDVFDKARAEGLHSVPHAGETAGPDSIWSAINLLGAERIGHGVRCVEDPDLVSYLRDNQIPLEVCLTSNIKLGVYKSINDHPLRKLFDSGIRVTINSDDPALFNTTLCQEYETVRNKLYFSVNELLQMTLNALKSSFLPDYEKHRISSNILKSFIEDNNSIDGM